VIRIAAAVHPDELDADAAAQARGYAGRKVFRLLERMSIPPFVVAHELVATVDAELVPDLALVVVSGWEPDVPDSLGRHEGDTESRLDLVARMQALITPTKWLTGLPNNALCQIAVTTGILGPNLHLVGDGETVVDALELVSDLLHRGAAPGAIVLAFDSAAPRQRPPDEVDSVACGVLVRVGDGPGEPLEIPEVEAVRGLLAVDAMTRVAGDARSERADR
jgi:hypothetical protein